MASKYVPATDHIVRFVSWSRLAKDDDESTVIGVLPQAFLRRPGEETLSATWAEFHGRADLLENVMASARTIRASNVTVGPKSAFAYASVAELSTAAQAFGKKIRVIHEPEQDNQAHVGIHRWPDEVDELMARIAALEWRRFIRNQDIPQE